MGTVAMLGHGYKAAASPVHHHHDDRSGHLARVVNANGTYEDIDIDHPPEDDECRYEMARDRLAEEAEMARAMAAEGEKYNDPTFPTIVKGGQALEFSTYNEALIHMERMLVDGVDINSRDRHNMTALHYNFNNDEVVDWLHTRGCELDAPGIKGRTALHLACSDFKVLTPEVNHLLNLGANPNVQDDDGMTPLMMVCQMHNKSGVSRVSMVRNLLNSHADPGIYNKEGNALHHSLWAAVQDAAQDGDAPAILRTILASDKDCINVGTPGTLIEHRAESDGNTPLQRLCKMDSEVHPSYGVPDPECLRNVCEYFIQNKADYRGPDGEGVPPRRRVRSAVMRKFFNDAARVGVPGSPAKF